VKPDGSAPVVERVAVRIVELAGAGEFDPAKLTATVVAEFGRSRLACSERLAGLDRTKAAVRRSLANAFGGAGPPPGAFQRSGNAHDDKSNGVGYGAARCLAGREARRDLHIR
jgi:hypothetical protein